jgi:hypothetical protein
MTMSLSSAQVPSQLNGADDKPRPSHQPAGRGAYAIRALPDLCLGIQRGDRSNVVAMRR